MVQPEMVQSTLRAVELLMTFKLKLGCHWQVNTTDAGEDPGRSPPPLCPGPLNSQPVLPETIQSRCAVPEDWVSERGSTGFTGGRGVGMGSEVEELETGGASTLCWGVGAGVGRTVGMVTSSSTWMRQEYRRSSYQTTKIL